MFQVKTESTTNQGAVKLNNMDLTQFSKFELVFGSAASKITISNVTDPAQANIDLGEILFKVDAATTDKIQNLDDAKFYIVTVGKDGSRSALYTGKWYKSDEISTADTENAQQLSKARAESDLADTVESLKVRITELESENAKLKTSSVKDTVSQPAGDIQDIPRTTINPIRLQRPVKPRSGFRSIGGDTGFSGSGGQYGPSEQF